MKNGQTYFNNLTLFTPQDFLSMFGHFGSLCMKRVTDLLFDSVALLTDSSILLVFSINLQLKLVLDLALVM